MFRIGPVTLAEPLLALIALSLSLVAIAIAFRRRIDLPQTSRFLIVAGLLVLSFAAGLPTFDRSDNDEVLVMVDLSPSTRTARYRDPAFLRKRIDQLLGHTSHRTIYFAEDHQTNPPAPGSLADLSADQTRLAPPDAAAILLFSDAQFDLPATAPPTFVVLDPLLQSPPDASIVDLTLRSDNMAAATVHNQSPDARALSWLPSGAMRQVPPGLVVLTSPPLTSSEITARLSPADAWPENDALRLRVPPPDTFERWWISASASPQGWRRIAPDHLPTDPAAYLAPSVIALDNVPAVVLSESQQQRLHQYVRDLGGSLLILGGDRSFAAGAYAGTSLDALSPLSSSPPTPTTHWLLLADASGSMAAVEDGRSRWDVLQASLRALLPHLPPNDPISIGSFAENLRWWSTGRSVRETGSLQFPTITPLGPTNLESALNTLISQSDPAIPKELLLLTDADAEITQLDALQMGLREKRIRLHVLALRDDGRALKELEQLAQTTNGQSLRQLEPAKWTRSIEQLFQQAAPDRLITEPVPITFLSPLDLPQRHISPVNRTWLKSAATLLAHSRRDAEDIPMSARWNMGTGSVLATAFRPNVTELESLARQIEQPPRDPRFKVTIDPNPQLSVTIDAIDGATYLNNLALVLELTDLPPATSRQTYSIPQSAPGRYELTLPAPTHPALATIRHEGNVIARRALPARHPPEFESIGNDLPRMRELAARTGGQVVPPMQTTPVQFDFPTRPVSLTSWLAAAGALLLAAGLVRWRLG
jgi:hypothetical protein